MHPIITRMAETSTPEKHQDPETGGRALVEAAFMQRQKAEHEDDDIFDPGNFEQVSNRWWLDRVMPGGVKAYFIAVFAICTGAWALGLGLRMLERNGVSPLENARSYVLSREWQ